MIAAPWTRTPRLRLALSQPATQNAFRIVVSAMRVHTSVPAHLVILRNRSPCCIQSRSARRAALRAAAGDVAGEVVAAFAVARRGTATVETPEPGSWKSDQNQRNPERH